MASSKELRRRVDEFAREMAEEFGDLPQSHEPLMTQIEDWATEIGDAVMTTAVQRKLESSASPNEQECCPTCGRPGSRKGERVRLLQTRRGKVHLEDVEYSCSACRKSFFPDVQTAGD